MTASVAIVHDYLTQRGGAERVVLSMLKAFPDAPLYTSLYHPEGTFPEFAGADIRTLPLNGIPPLRRNHRLALPLLASAFSRCRIAADVVLCSSSGWAHGAVVEGRKVVYCYSPARWLYQSARYLGERRSMSKYAALRAMRPYLRRWDRRAAATADQYLTSSTSVADRIRTIYGIEAEIVAPPQTVVADGPLSEVEGLAPGYLLCVSRLLPYKNLDPIIEAFRRMPDQRLVVVGTGPEGHRLVDSSPPNVRFLGGVSDDELRWIYKQSAGLVAASYEDYGLTPLEAAAFGKPVSVLAWGGFRDTVIEGRTGVFFERPDPTSICGAVRTMRSTSFALPTLQAQADRYSEGPFVDRLRQLVMNGAVARGSPRTVPGNDP